MAQHHFVVIYDDERNTWEYDSEETGSQFVNGEIYAGAGAWFCAYGDDTPEDFTEANERASGDLVAMLALGQYARNMGNA